MDGKIKVLHILDELNTGGAERIVVSYFQHIDRDKFQWDFIITQYAEKDKRGILEDEVERLGGHIYRVHRKRENYLLNIRDTAEIIKKGHYHIVHSHLDELSAFYLMSARRAKVPVRICHSHLAGADRGTAVEVFCKFLKPFLRLAANHKFACGEMAGEALWGHKALESNQVHIMHNAIETERFGFDQSIRAAKRQELGIDNQTVLGFVGRLSYQKNPEYLIDIIEQCIRISTEYRLLIVGTGELEEKMKQLAKQAGVDAYIQFLGPRSDVNELMMAMDVFLLPSRFEGLPIVLVEAQCGGLKCIVSDTVTKEIQINPNVYYLPKQNNINGWTKTITEADSFERELGVRNIEAAHYRINVEAKNLQDYYLTALGKNDK